MALLRKFTGPVRITFKKVRLALSPYFIGLLVPSSGSYNISARGKYTSSTTDGLFICGGSADGRLLKLSHSGTISFQNIITPPSEARWKAITTPSSGNIYTAGDKEGFFDGRPWITKYDSSGSVIWSKIIALFGYDLDGITTDASENIYVVGRRLTTDFDSGNSIQIASLNSSGTIRWQIRFGNIGSGTSGFQGRGISTYSTSVYAVGIWYNPSYETLGVFAKFSQSAGAIEFEKSYPAGTQFFSIAQSASSGNCYIGGVATGGGAPRLVLKTDSSGTKQWGSTIATGSGAIQVAIDSSENVYSICTNGSYNLVIAKHNSSGTIQWQRDLTLPYQFLGTSQSISITPDNKIFISSIMLQTSPSVSYPFIALLNQDGSGTGTYILNGQTYTYAASSYTTSTDSGSFSTSVNGKIDESRSVSDVSVTTTTDTVISVKTTI